MVSLRCVKRWRGDDQETITRATEDLNRVVQQIGAAAYQQAGPETGAPEGAPAGAAGENPTPDDTEEDRPEGDSGDDEEVVDGEFRNA